MHFKTWEPRVLPLVATRTACHPIVRKIIAKAKYRKFDICTINKQQTCRINMYIQHSLSQLNWPRVGGDHTPPGPSQHRVGKPWSQNSSCYYLTSYKPHSAQMSNLRNKCIIRYIKSIHAPWNVKMSLNEAENIIYEDKFI